MIEKLIHLYEGFNEGFVKTISDIKGECAFNIPDKELTDAEKKKFLNTFIESVEIFKEEQPDGRLLKCINFKFPVFYDGDENVTHICWDSETTVECVCLLAHKE